MYCPHELPIAMKCPRCVEEALDRIGPALKPKKCKVCHTEFQPAKRMQVVCSPLCAQKQAARARAKVEKQERRAEAATLRARKQAMKTLPQLIKEAQVAFNAFIRERDKGQACICCDKPLTLDAVGGGYDCGHYRSTGSASHLRFNEDNAHAQRKHCNRYGAGRAVDYRLGLIKRIGLERVEALEQDNTPRKWTRDELIALRQHYSAKVREMKKEK